MKYCLALFALAGCLETGEPLASTADDLTSQNGLSLNGLSLNGLSLNGLSLNGLSLNGLSLNGLDLGLSTSQFAGWFHADPVAAAQQVTYLVKCAKPAGQTLTWTDPATRTRYAWTGELGLAPRWTNRAMTLAEQQVMSACMVAHANKYGVHVAIAVEGRAADGTEIARAPNELVNYPIREAGWFGNTANGEGVFVCLDHAPTPALFSSPRACAIDAATVGAVSPVCPPIVFAGACEAICTPDITNTYYTSCRWNGKSYLPLVTRFQLSSVYVCGDGTCQISEHCGTGIAAESCKADCGVCP